MLELFYINIGMFWGEASWNNKFSLFVPILKPPNPYYLLSNETPNVPSSIFPLGKLSATKVPSNKKLEAPEAPNVPDIKEFNIWGFERISVFELSFCCKFFSFGF